MTSEPFDTDVGTTGKLDICWGVVNVVVAASFEGCSTNSESFFVVV